MAPNIPLRIHSSGTTTTSHPDAANAPLALSAHTNYDDSLLIHKAPPPTPLLTLPSELIARVASLLPQPSVLAFSLTCWSVNRAVESVIYKEINLSLKSTGDCWGGKTRLGNPKLRKTRLARSVHRPLLEDTERLNVDVHRFGLHIVCLLRHLNEFGGSRLRSVRNLKFDTDRPLPIDMVRLLNDVNPTIASISLVGKDFQPQRRMKVTHLSLDAVIKQLHAPFLQLRHLEIPLNGTWEFQIRTLVKLAPNLEHLHLNDPVSFSNGWGEASRINAASKPDCWPPVPWLKVIEIEQVGPALIPMILHMARSARCLKKVALKDPEGQWKPSEGDKLLVHLSRAHSIWYLAISTQSLKRMLPQKGLHQLRVLALEEAACDARLTCSRMENLHIPPLPDLDRLLLRRSFKHNERIMLHGGEWPSLPEPLHPIPSETISDLEAAPKLLFIQHPSSPTEEFSDIDPPHLDPSTPPDQIDHTIWEYLRSRSFLQSRKDLILIRSYRSADSTDVLYHCRSFETEHMEERKMRGYRSKHVWLEYTHFRDEQVPANILCRVYSLSHLSSAWTVPGRGLQLTEESWEVLREWYEEEWGGMWEALRDWWTLVQVAE